MYRTRAGRAGAALALVAGAFTLGSCKKAGVHSDPAPTKSGAAPAATTAPTAVSALPDSLRKVYGRWQREDGGYVLEIRSGENGGVLNAGYFNPKPIHVSRAAWYEGAGRLQVFVELNDVGYPGATYVLFYDPTSDRLNGQYTQPSLRQTFDVAFARAVKP